MPAITPTWGLRYPCYGEVVTAASFQNLNEDIERALTSLDALRDAVLQRATIRWYRTTDVVVAAGAAAGITFEFTDFSTGWPAPANAPVKGLYEVAYSQNTATGFTTVTAENVSVNFGTYAGSLARTWNNINSVTGKISIAGVVPLNAGEVMSAQYAPFGTGNFTVPDATMSIRLIAQLP